MSPGSSAGSKGKRSRTGCGTCRARKVKCDERPNGCANCERLDIPCIRPGTKPVASESPSASPESFHRHRTFRSCSACRAAKVRCTGERPNCERCHRRRTRCEYDGKEAPRWVNRASQWRTQQSGDASSESDHEVQEPTADAGKGKAPALPDYPAELSWLFASALPPYKRLLRLVKLYFRLIHPLRCFGFIHRPSFMQALEERSEPDQNDAVLLVMCAISAKFYAASSKASVDAGCTLRAGSQWAQRAKYILFMSLNSPTPDTIMAAVLLHEHELRVGNYSAAFMITGLAVRLVQGLQLNVEPMSVQPAGSTLASETFIESCRRVMWAVYIMDAWVGSGVDELTMVHESTLKVRLPCDESDFVLEKVKTGPVVSLNELMREPNEGDLAAQFILLLALRKRVLRFVKHLDTAQPPWLETSEFATLCGSLNTWFTSLPKSLQCDRFAIQKRKVSDQHGALMMMHLTYYQTMCDLTRIGMPELFRIRMPIHFPADRADFVTRVQNVCVDHCLGVTNVFREALNHGHDMFGDTWACIVAHDSTRVIAHFYTKKVASQRDASFASGLAANLQALWRMIPLQALAQPLYASAKAMIQKADIQLPTLPEDDTAASEPARPPSPSPLTPEYVLNPLAIYRMARQDIRQHEKAPVPPSVDEDMQESFTLPPVQSPAPDMGYYPTGLDFQLPMGFDDLQMYMSLPALNQYEMGMGGFVYQAGVYDQMWMPNQGI